jgi:uncharacterized protein (DUF1330 family)
MAFVLSQVSLVVGPQEDLDDGRANNRPARHYGYHIKALSSATLSLGMPKRETTIKARWTIALSMLVGIALGAAAIKTLQAQAKPPVYMIAINEVSNQEGYTKEYVPPAQKLVKDHDGVYVAAGPGTQVTGGLPNGPVVILRWESMEALQSWRNSPEFQAALKIGEKYAKYNIIAVGGVK